MVHRVLIVASFAAACGGVEPLPPEPVEALSLLVRDDALATRACPALDETTISAKLEISGVLGACRVHLKEDRSALSICDEVPGQRERDLLLTYYVPQKQTELDLVTVATTIDLTTESRAMVEIDFARADTSTPDYDGDGATSLEELCAGRDPRDPNG